LNPPSQQDHSGRAKAMVVTGSRNDPLEHYQAIRSYADKA
jgi:hypothetical protein